MPAVAARFETAIDPAASATATTPRSRTGRSLVIADWSLRAQHAVDSAGEELHGASREPTEVSGAVLLQWNGETPERYAGC